MTKKDKFSTVVDGTIFFVEVWEVRVIGKARIEEGCQFDLSLGEGEAEIKEQARNLKPFQLVLEVEGKQRLLKQGEMICVFLGTGEKVRVRVQKVIVEAILHHQPKKGKRQKNTRVQIVVVQRILSSAEQDERRAQKRASAIDKALEKLRGKPSK